MREYDLMNRIKPLKNWMLTLIVYTTKCLSVVHYIDTLLSHRSTESEKNV